MINRPFILGGKKIITDNIKKANSWPIITRDDYIAVENVLRDGKLNNHPVIKDFESDCRDYFGTKHVLAHCNGTAALLACFFVLDLQPGDEILVPSATFWASVLPMLWVGAVPVFCDSEEKTLGIDPEDIERKITKRTKAIVIVHLWGMPCKVDAITKIAKKYNLKIIEDASHAQGAKWQGKMCGSIGDVSAISLVGNKLLPAGEGGIFLTNNDEYYEKAACLGDIARIIELKSNARRFASTGFGMKTRIASFSAAIGRSQLKSLNKNNQKRNENLQYLSQHLEELGFNTFLPDKNDDITRTYFDFIIQYDENITPLKKELLIASLIKEGCSISIPRYPLLHEQPIFSEGLYKKIVRIDENKNLPDYKQVNLPKTNCLISSLLRLPTFPQANQGLLDQYLLAFKKVLEYSDEITKAVENGSIKIDLNEIYKREEQLLVL